MLYNFRVTFETENSKKVDYWKNFSLMRKDYTLIFDIIKRAKWLGIKDIWFFFEPYIEITWLSVSTETTNRLFEYIHTRCREEGINDVKEHYPKDGQFADWFCKSEREMEFGAKRHAVCTDFVKICHEYSADIEKGKGLEEQVKRTIHTICNPLGLNYMDEAKICFSRGLICFLFRFIGFHKAVWIYTKIFRQKY
jgi:hypothetical protein